MKRALVCGAGGFIGTHLVRRLKSDGWWVRGVDLKYPEFSESESDEFVLADLRDRRDVEAALESGFMNVFQLAADMGGAGYIFTGEHDADILYNSAMVNLNVIKVSAERGVRRIFFASSACVYPAHNQVDPCHPNCVEDSVYPASPDSEYGWEKLFAERLCLAFSRAHGIDIKIGRLHNVFGPEGPWRGGREKVPAALCRKVAQAPDCGEIEIWGDGKQTRTFLYVDECIEAIDRLMRSSFAGPVNIGSDESVSIAELADMICKIASKRLAFKFVPGPQGVRGRTSDNTLIYSALGWQPCLPLTKGLEKTYAWISKQVACEVPFPETLQLGHIVE